MPLACAFSLSPSGLGEVDPALTNVVLDLGDGSNPAPIYRDESAPCEAGAQGWQFADDETVVLCGKACELRKENERSQVTIEVGCQTLWLP